MKESEKFKYLVAICVFAVLILIVWSLAVTYFIQEKSCTTNPETFCYDDWKCYEKDGENMGKEYNASKKYYLNGACQHITEETLMKFEYIPYGGKDFIIGQPGAERNVWDPKCQDDEKYESCDFYKVGDIYWKACHGTDDSKYCTTKDGKCSDL